jgi:CoA:oxalate CoA-transferase
VALRGETFVPKRTGSQHPDGGPTGLFRCGDGRYINITALAHQWEQLVAALEMPELLEDLRFRDARARRDNNADLKTIIEIWLASFSDHKAAVAALERHRVPCAPVLTLNEAAAHPHLRARNTVRRVQDPLLGVFDIPGMPARFSRWSFDRHLRADLLGERNEDVLHELTDLSGRDIAALYKENVLVRDPILDQREEQERIKWTYMLRI